MKRKALRVRSEAHIPTYVTEAESRKQRSDSPLYNSLLWRKSKRGVVANELHSDLQVSRSDPWVRRSNSEFVA